MTTTTTSKWIKIAKRMKKYTRTSRAMHSAYLRTCFFCSSLVFNSSLLLLFFRCYISNVLSIVVLFLFLFYFIVFVCVQFDRPIFLLFSFGFFTFNTKIGASIFLSILVRLLEKRIRNRYLFLNSEQ